MADEQKTETFNIRVAPAFLTKIDEWRRTQADIPGRAEAMRRLVVMGLQQEVIEQKAADLMSDGSTLNLTDNQASLLTELLSHIIATASVGKGEQPLTRLADDGATSLPPDDGENIPHFLARTIVGSARART